ncbi:ligase-associated DNA damage response endonuclease PdeM [Luteirhabdus pelagi]|uniref:ligase-associated DNA damage response endonuclease PdeM n=1 Tax=Luteirhabdus pelagi TaxID=2792783 RepID=UPI001939546E|nr:ligase-associated DNA damage response endonuclease PdeM [Luteirhabdus pelagi]
MQQISIHNNEFLLHPTGTAYWKDQDMLLVADVHLGKVSHFRKHGSAIPAHVAYQNLEKLTDVVNELSPKTVCFLGDLFHSELNQEWDDFTKWAEYTAATIILVAGNHDIIAPDKYLALGIQVVPSLDIDGFSLTHHPIEQENYFNIAGHIHPGVRLQGLARQSVKLPCFFKSEKQLILPAFGTFTGKYILKPTETDEVYALVEGEVLLLR